MTATDCMILTETCTSCRAAVAEVDAAGVCPACHRLAWALKMSAAGVRRDRKTGRFTSTRKASR